ncbi:unnamed protein product [Protopolystoma xenopodis]|uniref:Uncharacterized protein n=1 Tax=Protopolystoma xenopodis TaxID=117903 RepID=A0A3S5FFF1_9PLAT|nr:unnamed protein product [Protopolystoma xenopodis]
MTIVCHDSGLTRKKEEQIPHIVSLQAVFCLKLFSKPGSAQTVQTRPEVAVGRIPSPFNSSTKASSTGPNEERLLDCNTRLTK